MWQAEKMPGKVQSKEKEPGHAEERAGPSDETKEPEEYSHNKMITAISEILDSKLASLANKRRYKWFKECNWSTEVEDWDAGG